MLTLNDLTELQTGSEYNPQPLPITPNEFPKVNHQNTLKEFFDADGVKTGEIRLELGADGVWLQFDCDCTDALPYCQAQCCALIGTAVTPEEISIFDYPVDISDFTTTQLVMERGADGFCRCLDRDNRTCKIYDNRPATCRNFHCTRGADVRGWKLNNHVNRQSNF
ncbi:MAG: YkgJ family cysteine cluster protein [Microcoleus sp.]